MEVLVACPGGRIVQPCRHLDLAVIAHEDEGLDAPEALADQRHGRVLEPAQDLILPVHVQPIEGAALAQAGEPAQDV